MHGLEPAVPVEADARRGVGVPAPSEAEVHELRAYLAWWNPRGFVHLVARPGVTVELDDAREVTEVIERLAGGVRVPVLVDFRRARGATWEAQRHVATVEGGGPVSAVATILGRRVHRVLGRLTLPLVAPAYALRLFGDEPSALAWLEQFLPDSGSEPEDGRADARPPLAELAQATLTRGTRGILVVRTKPGPPLTADTVRAVVAAARSATAGAPVPVLVDARQNPHLSAAARAALGEADLRAVALRIAVVTRAGIGPTLVQLLARLLHASMPVGAFTSTAAATDWLERRGSAEAPLPPVSDLLPPDFTAGPLRTAPPAVFVRMVVAHATLAAGGAAGAWLLDDPGSAALGGLAAALSLVLVPWFSRTETIHRAAQLYMGLACLIVAGLSVLEQARVGVPGMLVLTLPVLGATLFGLRGAALGAVVGALAVLARFTQGAAAFGPVARVTGTGLDVLLLVVAAGLLLVTLAANQEARRFPLRAVARWQAVLAAQATDILDTLLHYGAQDFARAAPVVEQPSPLNPVAAGINVLGAELAQATARAKEREQDLRIVADGLPALVAHFDERGLVRFANVAFRRFFGLAAAELRGAPLPRTEGTRVVHDLVPLGVALSGGPAASLDVRWPDAAGEPRDLALSVVPHGREDGRAAGAFLLAADITARKRAEAQARESQAQLVQAAKLAALGEMSGGLAHELNNPIFVAAGHAEELVAALDAPGTTDPSALRAHAVSVLEATDRMARLVRHFRDFARQGSAPVREVALDDVVDGALRLVGAQLAARGIRVTVARAPGARVVADPYRLEQVLLNLLFNARDAIAAATGTGRGEVQVRIRAGAAGSPHVLEVEDDGAGIPPGVAERVFEPFFTTKPVGEGTGLGLSISHGIVAEYGGRLDFETRPGRGTTFRVTLPAARGGAEGAPCADS